MGQTLLELNDGFPNKVGECELSRDEDSVMSLATTRPGQIVGGVEIAASPDSPKPKKKSGKKKRPAPMPRRLSDIPEAEVTALVFAGVNSGMKDQEKGVNEHFRAFKVSTAAGSVDPFERRSVFSVNAEQKEIYQRIIRVSPSGAFAVIATGGGKTHLKGGSEVVVVDTQTYAVRERIEPEGGKEVTDLDVYTINDVRETLAYSTGDKVYIHTIAASSNVSEKPKAIFTVSAGKGAIRSVRILSPTIIAFTLNLPGRTGAELNIINTSGHTILAKKLASHIKATSSLDALSLPSIPTQHALAIAAADMSITIFTFTETTPAPILNLYQTFRNVHPFQITKLAFSPAPRAPEPSSTSDISDDEKSGTGVSDEVESISLASVSMGNTLVVHTLPLHETREGKFLRLPGGGVKKTVATVVGSLGVVLVLAIILQVMFVQRGFGGLGGWEERGLAGMSGMGGMGGEGEKCDTICKVPEKESLLEKVGRESEAKVEEVVVEVPHVADEPGEVPVIETIKEEL